MKTESIDSIVRRALLNDGLPLHYYTRYLNHAINILEELALDFPINNVKIVDVPITSYNRAILPTDYVDYVSVNIKAGDRALPMERVRTLNKKYNYDTNGNKIPYPSEHSINFDSELAYNLISGLGNTNPRGELLGRYYGRVRNPTFVFDIDEINSEIVLGTDVTSAINTIQLTYITNGYCTSCANAVTPYAVDVIIKYIKMMAAKAQSARLGEYQLLSQEFYNAKRILRARLHSMDTQEVLASIRNGIHGSIKN